MKICIDTNIYVAYKKGDKNITSVLEEVDQILVPSVVLGELLAGFFIGTHKKKNMAELDEFLLVPGIEIVNVDLQVAEKYGYLIKSLRDQGNPIPTNDVWIAATCLEHGAKLFTLDKHFDLVPGVIQVVY